MIFGGFDDYFIINVFVLYFVLYHGASSLQLASVVSELDSYLGIRNRVRRSMDCASISREPALCPIYGAGFSKRLPRHAMAGI